jgi:hypothetical protein
MYVCTARKAIEVMPSVSFSCADLLAGIFKVHAGRRVLATWQTTKSTSMAKQSKFTFPKKLSTSQFTLSRSSSMPLPQYSLVFLAATLSSVWVTGLDICTSNTTTFTAVVDLSAGELGTFRLLPSMVLIAQ